jgi:hypothetical protein
MDHEIVGSFYRAAHLGLRVLDGRGARRRFGREADARWVQFRGDLTDADRFDLLLRDAAGAAPLAFAPREVFDLEGLSHEDPFGVTWAGPPRGLAGNLLRAELDAPDDPVAAFDAAAALWEVPLLPLAPDALPRILPSTRLAVGGVSALRSLVAHFAAHRGGLDLADQVTLVADRPVERQLFGLATVFLATPTRGRCVAPREARALRVDSTLASDDASEAVREALAASSRSA